MGLITKLSKIFSSLFILTSFVLIYPANYSISDQKDYKSYSKSNPVISKNGMVVSGNRWATKAGINVLREGGNAIDAAVTVGFTLAVTFPRAGNLGGGGFMLIRIADSNKVIAIDYREKAPISASKDMFLDENGSVDTEKSRNSILSVGVPGTVAGLTLALEKYGTISLEQALKPAIQYAEKGFPVSYEFRQSLLKEKNRLQDSPESMSIFFKSGGAPYEVGEILKQKDLATSLKLIRNSGSHAFYEGEISKKIINLMLAKNGLITSLDLKSYKPVIRMPLHGTYRDLEIYSMPPPSSGGVHLIQMLNVLENFNLSYYEHNSTDYINVLSETSKYAYADRSKYLGDPDFQDIPVNELTSEEYTKEISKKIKTYRLTPSKKIKPGNINYSESNNTTHFSVMDRYGNVVSNTYTLNFAYGSGLTVPGTGILLNNEMDDFSAKPGTPNAYGLIGGTYNSIEPEKRMLSSMTPTIVMKDNKPYLATGSPGGSRIITTVLQIILNVVDYRMNINDATDSPRFHHQWLPDKLYIENELSKETIRDLNGIGHITVKTKKIGNAQSILKKGKYFLGYSDTRRPGGLALGF